MNDFSCARCGDSLEIWRKRKGSFSRSIWASVYQILFPKKLGRDMKYKSRLKSETKPRAHLFFDRRRRSAFCSSVRFTSPLQHLLYKYSSQETNLPAQLVRCFFSILAIISWASGRRWFRIWANMPHEHQTEKFLLSALLVFWHLTRICVRRQVEQTLRARRNRNMRIPRKPSYASTPTSAITTVKQEH